MSDGLFCTKQASQLQPGGALNKPPHPAEDERGVVVELEAGVVDCPEICCGEASGPGEVRATGEAKPRENGQS